MMDSVLVKLSAFPARFWLPQRLMENIDAWIHEFTELALRDLIRSQHYFTHISFSIDEEHIHTEMHHLMASLCCVSLIGGDELVDPDEFWDFLNTRSSAPTANEVDK